MTGTFLKISRLFPVVAMLTMLTGCSQSTSDWPPQDAIALESDSETFDDKYENILQIQ